MGWGEIAPIAAFGSESVEQAEAWCRSLPSHLTQAQIEAQIAGIPASLPACQFGFGMAWEQFSSPFPSVVSPQWTGDRRDKPLTLSNDPSPNLTYSTLLPTGTPALTAWQPLWQQGSRTFKWKIGVAAIEQELAQVEQLLNLLPDGTCLRLDANGGLTWDRACTWLERCDALNQREGAKIEFIEQPLPPEEFDRLLHLNQQFQTPIALDESVAHLTQLATCYHQGWRGIFVIKAAIVGFPQQLRQFCQQYPIDIVWSSVFETAIARSFIQDHFIPSLSRCDRAIGFGVDHLFAESLFNSLDFEQLWRSL